MGVTLMREEGESKDCDLWMRILGEGVLSGGHIVVAMISCSSNFGNSSFYVNLGLEGM